MNNSPWWTNLISVAVGGAIGFASAYFIAIHLYKKQVSREENLQVVKKLYVPLYRELIMFQELLAFDINHPNRAGNYCWFRFFTDRRDQFHNAGISFGVWGEMKNDFRSILMPKKAQARLDKFLKLLSDYNTLKDLIDKYATDYVDEFVATRSNVEPSHIKLREQFHYGYMGTGVAEGDIKVMTDIYKHQVDIPEPELVSCMQAMVEEFSHTEMAKEIGVYRNEIPAEAESLQAYFGNEIRVLTGLKDED